MLALSGGAAQACTLADVGWLAGTWRVQDDHALIEEHWTAMSSGALLDTAWSVSPRAPRGVVKLQAISQAGDTLILQARHFDAALGAATEDKTDPITFAASACGRDFVTFSGTGRWAGGSLSYRRSGDSLTVSGEAHDNGASGHFEKVFTRVK
jgi:hypothetical protein